MRNVRLYVLYSLILFSKLALEINTGQKHTFPPPWESIEYVL